ncbi:MAG TPA: NTPase [Actinomycetota bacterium]|nr:NTPase [Actinomycetota bacterium]
MPRILLEGRPGVGKTTVARRLVADLRSRGVEVAGFTTRELREHGRRVGFEIEDLGGEAGVLAHVDLPGPPRVGRYGVDLSALEQIALRALRRPADLLVIDELGKMELASADLRRTVSDLFDTGGATIVATVHAGAHSFIDALVRRPDVEIVRVSERNRDGLPAELAGRLAGR